MSARIRILGVFAVLLAAIPAVSQDTRPDPQRRKIGLVLEGGAALGLAHIGVLEWLEEHRIPVDYVAGTSMGGLVGGIYSTGNSPSEIRGLVSKMDWDELLRGEIPYRDLSYRRKEDAEDYPNRLEFGIREGIKFPEGFNSGHQIGLMLDRIALPYSEMKSFDDLPIPFACVGTDLVSGKAHVFRDGSLANALRATMSIPGVFTPVRTGTSVFVDGGLLDNLPVDVAKTMGADLIIAVHLQTQPLEADQPLSSFGVLGRSISVVISDNELRSMENADILVSVPLQKYGSSDYEKSAEIIQLGYEAAANKAAILSSFSLDEAEWGQYRAQRASRRKKAATPQFIDVTGTSPLLANEIERRLSNNIGRPVDTASLDDQLTFLSGIGRYSSMGYRMVERDDQQGLLIEANEKEYGSRIVRPLLVVDGSEYNNVLFMVGARITFLDAGSVGAEWRNDITLGSEYGARTEYFRPFGKGLHWFVAPQAFAENKEEDFYTGSTFIADYRNRQVGGALDGGYIFNRSSEVRLGYEIADQSFYPSVGAAAFGTLQGREGITSLRFNLVGRDNPIIPTDGFDLNFKTSWYDANPGATSGFPLTEAHMILFKPINPPSSIFFSAAGGTTYTYHQVGFPPFSLGGGQDLVAYGSNQFLTDQYYLFKAGYLRKLWRLPPLLGDKVYALGTYEIAKVFNVGKQSTIPTDFVGALVVNTIFGPVTVGAAYGATGHQKFFYRIGRVF